MDEYIEMQWTTGSIDEARRVCRFLVQERLVACAQIIPWVESNYMWNNQIETTQESKVALKTIKKNFEKVKQAILENSQYDVPEVTYRSIEGGNREYLDWISESTMQKNTAS